MGPSDVKQVVLTHLHMDHDGGLAHFPTSKVLVTRRELHAARGWAGRIRGYLPHRWPSWFDPVPLELVPEQIGPFSVSARLTQDGTVVAVATPGHTAGHVSVLAQLGDTTFFMAGDTSYNEELMLAGKIDGVSADEAIASATLRTIRRLTRERPVVYLPTHDPRSAVRLVGTMKAFRRVVAKEQS